MYVVGDMEQEAGVDEAGTIGEREGGGKRGSDLPLKGGGVRERGRNPRFEKTYPFKGEVFPP